MTPSNYEFKDPEVDVARFASGTVVRCKVDCDDDDPEVVFVALVALANHYAKLVGNADRPWINLQGLYENLVADDEIPGTLTFPIKKVPLAKQVDEQHASVREMLEAEARAWLIDCFPEEEQDIRDASLALIQRQVEKYYDGGITSFTLSTIGRKLDWPVD